MNIGYCRVSTEEQARTGYSLEFQETELRNKFAQMGITDYRIMRDNGVSAKNMNRASMKKINNYIKDGEVDILLVYKLDRLTRNLSDLILFLNDCALNNVKFISLVERLDVTSAIGRLFVYIIGILAQFEREQISERTFTGLIEKARKGEYPYRLAPYGFTKDDNHKLHKNLEQVQIIRQVYQMYALDYEPESILLEYGDSVGLKFHKGIHQFLSRYIYQGLVEIPKTSGHLFQICEPIFSEDEVKNIDDRKHQNKKRGLKKNNYKYFNKVRINGKPTRHTKIIKHNNLEYYYYYIKGVAFVNEVEIDQYLYNLHRMKELKKIEKLEKQIEAYSKALISCQISKADFDQKYEELNQIYVEEVKFKYINVIVDNVDNTIKHFEIIEK